VEHSVKETLSQQSLTEPATHADAEEARVSLPIATSEGALMFGRRDRRNIRRSLFHWFSPSERRNWR